MTRESSVRPDPLAEIRDRRVFIETYGCTYNYADSKKLEVILKNQGCLITESAEDADCLILNTCIVIERTERQMRARIKALSGRELFVTGCLPAVEPGCGGMVIDPELIHPTFLATSGHQQSGSVAALQIAKGCAGHCTYCITKKARGDLVSHPAEEIIQEAGDLIAQGAVEIQLTAQDVSAWGRDIGSDLSSLLDALGEIVGDHRIRIGMMNPDTLKPILKAVLRSYETERIFSFFHIPIQSGSDQVLQRMGRSYTADDTREIIRAIQKSFPSARISTDIICGFPGETDSEFGETLDLLREIRPEKINITRYSRRSGTPAADWRDMPDRFKKDRSRQATALAREIFSGVYEQFIGLEMEVIVTEVVKEQTVTARDAAYRPVIITEPLEMGSRHRVRITDHKVHYLVGERIS